MVQCSTIHRRLLMNIHAIMDSVAGHKYISRGGIPDFEPEALPPGLPATPAHNLKFHGGKTIQSLTFMKFYVGGNTSWATSDIDNTDLQGSPTHQWWHCTGAVPILERGGWSRGPHPASTSAGKACRAVRGGNVNRARLSP
jgi:hypothetical protein